MMKMRIVTITAKSEGKLPCDDRILELSVLVPASQVTALERTAGAEGQTVGQLLRRVIGQFLDRTRSSLGEGSSS